MSQPVQSGGKVQKSEYLRSLENQYDGLKQSIEAIQNRGWTEKRELNADELRSIKAQGERAEALYTQIEDLSADAVRDAKVAAMAARVDQALGGGGDGVGIHPAGEPDGMYSLLPSDEQQMQLRTAIKEGRGVRFTTARLSRDPNFHTRAAVTLSLTGGRVGGMSGRLPEPRRLARAVGMVPVPSTTAGTSGPKFGATAGAAPVAEGGAKTEAATITKLDIAIKQLARWTTLSRMALLSQGDTLDQVLSWHAMFIAKDEDKLIIDALNTAAGSAIAFVSGDQRAPIRGAMAKVEDAVSAPCDAVLVHPDNYALVAGFDPTTADDVGGRVSRFGSGVLYPSSAVPTGFALVAAIRAGGSFIVADPPSVSSVEALTTNEVTVRSEELVGFDVRLVGAVAKIDIVTP